MSRKPDDTPAASTLAQRRRKLSKAQRQHLERLMTEIKNAEVAAQRFLGYCADEHNIELGRDDWKFDLEEMTFKQEESEPVEQFREGMLAALPRARNGEPHA